MEKTWKKYLNLWSALSGWRLFLFYTLHYTLVFVVLQHFVFSDFYEAGKTFIWTSDGMPQHFSRLVYISQTFRDAIQAFLNGEEWQIPLYDFNLGYMNATFRIDPFPFLGILFPWDRQDILYNILTLFRLYLVGVSFSAFGFYWKQKPMPILIGAISYVFCGYNLYGGIRHPGFMDFVIYLPLLIIGTEEVLRKKNPYLMITMVFISVFTDLYFACMLAILVVLYALVRFWDLYRNNRLYEFVGMIRRLAIGGGTGILLSAAIAIPPWIILTSTGRVGREMSLFGSMFIYDAMYYQEFIKSFVLEPGDIGSWTCLGFSVLAIPAGIALFIEGDKNKVSLRWIFILLTVMLSIPFVSYIFSGFNNFSNRWCFAYAFCVSVIIMFMIPWFEEKSDKEYKKVCIFTILYIIVCYYLLQDIVVKAELLVLVGLAILLIAICRTLKDEKKMFLYGSCFLLTCTSIYYTSYLQYDMKKHNYISQFTSVGEPYKHYTSSQYASFAKSNAKNIDNTFYRMTGGVKTKEVINAAFYYDINGITGMPGGGLNVNYSNWKKELEVGAQASNLMSYGSDARTMLMAQEAVKYYMVRENQKSTIPYGFEAIESIGNGKNIDVLYENRYVMPIGYTYEYYMDAGDYEELSTLKKQESQLQAVVLKEQPLHGTIKEATDLQFLSLQRHPSIVQTKDLTWENGVLKVTEKNATMTLKFDAVPNAETYVRMVNLDLTSGSSGRKWNLKASTETSATQSLFGADAYLYSNGMKTQLLNLGYYEDGYTTCTLTFPEKGTFILDDIEIWCQPMDKYPEYIDALREEVLENVETNWRGLTGTISVSKDKMLCLSIPYDKGWKAYVDGERVELYQANTAFMALELGKGDHVVELKYLPPGMGIGMAMTAAGVVSLAGIIIYNRKKK